MLDISKVKNQIELGVEKKFNIIEDHELFGEYVFNIYLLQKYKLHFAIDHSRYGDIGAWYEFIIDDIQSIINIDTAIKKWLSWQDHHITSLKISELDSYFKEIGFFPMSTNFVIKKSEYIEKISKP